MVYCQNDQHWPWFIATVINRTLSEFFSKNKTDLRTLITCVRSLDLFYLITEREKKSVVFFIRFSSFTFVYIFTSTRKRSQLFFVRLRSFTFPPSPLFPFSPSPPLPSTLGLRLHPSNKSSRPASIILLSEVLHLFQSFFKRRNEWMHSFFQTFRKVKVYMHLFVYKILTNVTDVEFQVTFARHFSARHRPAQQEKMH